MLQELCAVKVAPQLLASEKSLPEAVMPLM
jgi:hypothetical protein